MAPHLGGPVIAPGDVFAPTADHGLDAPGVRVDGDAGRLDLGTVTGVSREVGTVFKQRLHLRLVSLIQGGINLVALVHDFGFREPVLADGFIDHGIEEVRVLITVLVRVIIGRDDGRALVLFSLSRRDGPGLRH